MNLQTGIDLIEISRIREAIERHGERFLQRIFTSRELEECGEQISSLAARYAAKEATAKALGTGIGEVSWHEIEILRGERAEPTLHLYGSARHLAQEKGLDTWAISLTHTQTHAIAMVVAAG